MRGMKPWRQKVIAFDYDETISLNRILFKRVMELFRECNWCVIICTWRDIDELGDLHDLKIEGYEIFATNRQAKREFMKNKGYEVDVWVDDFPEAIIMSLEELNK